MTSLPSACYTTEAHVVESGGHVVSMSGEYSMCTEVLRRRVRRNRDA